MNENHATVIRNQCYRVGSTVVIRYYAAHAYIPDVCRLEDNQGAAGGAHGSRRSPPVAHSASRGRK